MSFKPDDIVIIQKNLFGGGTKEHFKGSEHRIDCIYSGSYSSNGYVGTLWKMRSLETGAITYAYDFDLKLKNNSMTNIKEKFTLAFKKEPEKSFRKVGITNGDDFLTEDGMQIFLGWLLKKHGEEFKKEVVEDLLKEMEDKE